MDVIEAILNRKSIRYFKPYTIPEGDVMLLLECIRFAPSGGNRQPWEFLIVDDPGDIRQIYDFGWTAYGGGFNVCRFADASLLVFFLGGAQCYLAAENLTLAAYGLGYGSCMIGAFDDEKTKTLLGIPNGKRIRLFVAVGLADEARSNEARFTAAGKTPAEVLPYPPEARKPLAELVHHGTYGTPYPALGPGRTRAQVVGGFRNGDGDV
jgi:nitroreductase